jgi:hypothetical protein
MIISNDCKWNLYYKNIRTIISDDNKWSLYYKNIKMIVSEVCTIKILGWLLVTIVSKL